MDLENVAKLEDDEQDFTEGFDSIEEENEYWREIEIILRSIPKYPLETGLKINKE